MSEELALATSSTAEGGAAMPSAAPDSGAPAPAPDGAAPPDASGGPPRGPDGKFVSAATTALEPPPPDADASASGKDPSDPAAAPKEPPATPGSPQAPQAPVPFTFRASGQRIPIEGALYEPGKGLTIPDAKLPDVRRLLAHGYEYATEGVKRERQLRQQIGELTQSQGAAKAAEDAELSVYKEWFVDLLSDASGAKLLDAVQNFSGTSALLAAKAEAARLRKQSELTASPKAPETTPEAQQQQIVQSLVRVGADYVEEMRESGGYAALTEEDWKAAAAMVAKRPALFYAVVDGEGHFDAEPLIEWAKDRQALRAESAQRTQQVAKATEYNAKRAAAPPAPSALPRPAAPTKSAAEEEESIRARHVKHQEAGRTWAERMGVG